ncbi:hypothetical protein EON63_04075 [archaeon]|nr:MAG: hypothetical protein EON63_04075 [archaeon]
MFLELCNLPPKSYYQQLCSASGNNIHLSNKPGSVGRTFLDAVAKFFEVQSYPPFHEVRVDSVVTDLNHDYIEELHQLGIFGVAIDVEEKKITVACSDSAEETKIIDYLRGANIELDELVVEFHWLELLFAPPALLREPNLI